MFNAEPYIEESVQSILNQTFEDFELLVIDDGSTDNSLEIVESIPDPRIRIIRNEVNKGLIYSLNLGVKLAEGEYIARMDADDISTPDRFAKQVSFLDNNPNVGIVGSNFRFFDATDGVHVHPEKSQDIIDSLLMVGCVIGHPTVMVRKRILDKVEGPYEPEYKFAEDYRLWSRFIGKTEFHNIQEILLNYRIHDGQVSTIHNEGQNSKIITIKTDILKEIYDVENNDDNNDALQILTGYGTSDMFGNVRVAMNLFSKIISLNGVFKIFSSGRQKMFFMSNIIMYLQKNRIKFSCMEYYSYYFRLLTYPMSFIMVMLRLYANR